MSKVSNKIIVHVEKFNEDPEKVVNEVAEEIALRHVPDIMEYDRAVLIDRIDEDTIENIADELAGMKDALHNLAISKLEELKVKDAYGSQIEGASLKVILEDYIHLAVKRRIVKVPVKMYGHFGKKEPVALKGELNISWDPRLQGTALAELESSCKNLDTLASQYANEYAEIVATELIDKINNYMRICLESMKFIIRDKISYINNSLLHEYAPDEQKEKAIDIVLKRNKEQQKLEIEKRVKREMNQPKKMDLDKELKECIEQLSDVFPGLTAVCQYESAEGNALANLGFVKLITEVGGMNCSIQKYIEKIYEQSGRKLTLMYKPKSS